MVLLVLEFLHTFNALGIMERLQPQALKGRANGSPFQGSAVEMQEAV